MSDCLQAWDQMGVQMTQTVYAVTQNQNVATLPLSALGVRIHDTFIKSCRTSHSEMGHQQQHILGRSAVSPVKNQDIREMNMKLQQQVESLKEQCCQQLAEIIEKDGRLRYHLERQAQLKQQINRLNAMLDKQDLQSTKFFKLDSDRLSIEFLLEQVKRLKAQNERLKRSSVEFRTKQLIQQPWQNKRLAHSDVNAYLKLESNQTEEDNFFQLSNYSKKDKTATLINVGMRGSTFGGLPSEDRVKELEEKLSKVGVLLEQTDRKNKEIQSYYEETIRDLRKRIKILQGF